MPSWLVEGPLSRLRSFSDSRRRDPSLTFFPPAAHFVSLFFRQHRNGSPRPPATTRLAAPRHAAPPHRNDRAPISSASIWEGPLPSQRRGSSLAVHTTKAPKCKPTTNSPLTTAVFPASHRAKLPPPSLSPAMMRNFSVPENS